MIIWRKLLCDSSGGAAVEMALATPLLLALLFGSVELGNYFYNEHKLVKSVRDGARYAARQRFSNFIDPATGLCLAQPDDPVPADTELMTRKGTLDSTAPDLLPNWDNGSTAFSVAVTCKNSLDDGSGGNLAFGGIYADAKAPTVLVTASLPYRPVIGGAFGFSGIGLTLNATQSAAVMGL